MNIIEAIKSGKPIKRANYRWIIPMDDNFEWPNTLPPVPGSFVESFYITPEDILAEDWIVKDE